VQPHPLRLKAGDGARLRTVITSFLAELREDLPKAFREEAFDTEKARVVEAFQDRQKTEEQQLSELAAKEGFAIRITPQGNVAFAPIINGKPIESEEEWAALPPERIARFEEARRRIEHDLRDHFERSREERHHVDEEVHAIERGFARRLIEPRINAIAYRFGDPKLTEHLHEMLEYLLHHLEPFRSSEPSQSPIALLMGAAPTEDTLGVYDVNVVVDNSRTETPPTMVVDSPTYKNLFGTIDRVTDRFGRLVTDFRRIQAGALLRADGGAVVLSAEDALVEPFVWRILRRSLRSGRIEIEAYDPFVMLTPAAIRPQPIQVDTKVVLVGPRWLFEMLLVADEEFGDLFKILADFSPVVERTDGAIRTLCGRIARLVEENGLLPFESDALDAVVELAIREAGDRRRIDLGSERVLDAAREGSASAQRRGEPRVKRSDVEVAILDREHRLDRIDQEIRQAVERGLILIDVRGSRVGQLNALSVMELGARAFGRPGRVTATVGLGQRGVVNIEREAKLSGARHDKGILILEGFLRNRFARERPLSLVASVAFEQSYGPIDGDSASLAELLAILSRIGGFELRQDLAVTGSVNQVGEVQAVGGLNEKIEGFYDCCRNVELTGTQGVLIPEANVENLTLRPDVVAAIDRGAFRVHPVRSVDEALEALTGIATGVPDEPDTLCFAIDQALEQMAQQLVGYSGGAPGREEEELAHDVHAKSNEPSEKGGARG
jgi:ATP-dependent Lon protease